MRQDDHTTTSLHVCTDCHQPFVVPVSVLDVVDGDRCVVELHCANCDETRIGLHDELELIDLDEQLERSAEALRNALDVFDAVDEWERAERFIAALHAGHIVPDDF